MNINKCIIVCTSANKILNKAKTYLIYACFEPKTPCIKIKPNYKYTKMIALSK